MARAKGVTSESLGAASYMMLVDCLSFFIFYFYCLFICCFNCLYNVGQIDR